MSHRGLSVPSVVYLPRGLVESPEHLPGVCVRHGRPASTTKKVTFVSKTPGWTILLIFISLLIALLIALAMQKRVKAPAWPVCPECVSLRRKRLAVGWGLLVPAPIAAMFLNDALPFSGDGWDIFVMLVVAGSFIGGLVMLAATTWSNLFAANVASDGTHVRFRKVHPAFVAALPPPPPPMYAASTATWVDPHVAG
jgi:hypothetical protein